jgi:hypothetical protein
LAEISPASKYCKIVQADDCIFPECLELMVKAFEQSESVGLVSSYDLKGNTLRGSGFPFPTSRLEGKEMARRYLRNPVWVFGSASTVMYRSSLVRSCRPFYQEGLLHEDTEKCMQILEHWDFGFVHQVLSFLRDDNVNESISAGFHGLQPHVLDRYIIVQRYAPIFLEPAESAALRKETKRAYYRVLAREALRLREAAFWQHHRVGLKTLGETFDVLYLSAQIGLELLWMAANPGMLAARVLRYLKRRLGNEGVDKAGRSLEGPTRR